ncbi:MAG: ABC transporter ATP-binding protein [Planctomycetaceae bacterium]|nr:ABC transporter ATP-binding protein [Planctomycetaceae bacterium]
MTRPSDGRTVIEARRLGCMIGRKPILRDVSFQIRQGQYVSIVGPNGAGKTTLLKCLDRIVVGQISGELDIDGRSWDAWRQSDLAKRMALVPQADSRAMPFSVEQFLLMSRYPHLSPFATVRSSDRQAVREAMAAADALEFAGRRMDTLSSGERQRIYIAAALAQGATIWLLDEPTTFLDYRHQDEILALVASANRRLGVTVVAVTHDLNHAVLESDRILALCDGALVFDGEPAEVMKPDVLRCIYGASPMLVAHPRTGMPMIVPRGVSEVSEEPPR